MGISAPSEAATRVRRVTTAGAEDVDDRLAAEEPLGILLTWPGRAEPFELAVTMRTPGDDEALAIGYLLSESLLAGIDVCEITRLPGVEREASQILVALSAAPHDLDHARRMTWASSSCGLCGKASVASVLARDLPPLAGPTPVWTLDTIRDLPRRMRASQDVFEQTGGLHAAALFTADGQIRVLCEDVGRHNAVDKVVGELWRRSAPVGEDDLLVVSGRAGFEIAQKGRVAGIAGMAAVGAPSSLAVDLARRSGMTLIGFLRDDHFNVYAGGGRLGLDEAASA